MAAISTQDVMDHLGIDVSDDMTERKITRCIKVAESYLEGSLGKGYPVDDPRVQELMLVVVSDLYDNRGMTEKVSGTVRKLVSDFSLQLRLEMRGSDEA